MSSNRTRAARGAADLLVRAAGTWVPAALLGIVVIVVSVDVAGRYLLRQPFRPAPDIAVLGFTWVVFLGAIGVTRRDGHIGVKLLINRLPEAWQVRVRGLVDLVVTMIQAVIAYAAVIHLMNSRFTTLPLTGMPKSWLMAAILVGLGTAAAITLVRGLLRLSGRDLVPPLPEGEGR